MVGGAVDEGALFHCVDVLQAFVERRKGGETGVKAVQCIRGPETWKWTERNPWAGKLLESVRTRLELKPGHFRRSTRPMSASWSTATGRKRPCIPPGCGMDLRRRHRRAEGADHHLDARLARSLRPVPRLERPAALDHRDDGDQEGTVQCGAAAAVHGIVAANMESNWENGRYSAVGRRIETPFMNMTYRSTRGPQFSTGARPPDTPYLRGFAS